MDRRHLAFELWGITLRSSQSASLPCFVWYDFPRMLDSKLESENPDIHWLRNVYRKGARQLTVRAAISGMLLGGLMCLSNLYVFFKTGWSMGVTVTASILAFAIFQNPARSSAE